MVSYDLSRIYPKDKRRSGITERASGSPTVDSRGVESVTPEIEFQGVPSRSRQRKNLLRSEESPLTGTKKTAITADELFFGFSPKAVLEALPEYSTSPTSVRRSPRNHLKQSVDNIALRLAARMTLMAESGEEKGQGLSRKRELDHSDDCLLYTSPSPRDATLSRMPSSA